MKDNYNGNRFYVAHMNSKYFNENIYSWKLKYMYIKDRTIILLEHIYNTKHWTYVISFEYHNQFDVTHILRKLRWAWTYDVVINGVSQGDYGTFKRWRKTLRNV